MAKDLDARPIWQKSHNRQHSQKELHYTKKTPFVLTEVPWKTVLANPPQCGQDLIFIFVPFVTGPLHDYLRQLEAHTQPHSYTGSPRPSAHCRAVCPSGVGQCVPRRLCTPPRLGLAAQGSNAPKITHQVGLPSIGESLGSSASLPVALSNRL